MKNIKLVSFSALILMTMLACSAVSNLMATPTPVPTNTPLPSPTPMPSPTPVSSVLFEDGEFTTSCNDDDTADVERFVEGGQFHMRVITSNYVAWSECTKVEYEDFVIEVDASEVSGPDNNTYGVIFRYGLEASEFYTFVISGDGYYALAIDGPERTEPEMIVPWTESAAIKQGVQTNQIKVVAIGTNIKFYVNGEMLGEVENSSLSKGTVGFFAGALDEGNVQVSFDNLVISEP